MSGVAIGLVAVLLIAFAVALALIAVRLGRVAVKGGAGLRSAKGFAAVAASQGWAYAERDGSVSRTLSPLFPETFDNTAALDVLRGHAQGREVLIFRYPPAGAGGGPLDVWAVGLPQPLPPFTLTSTDQEYARSLSPLIASMNGSGFADWRIQNGFLQAWSTGQGRDTRKLLTRLQSLTQAVDQIPPETWRKYGQ